MAAGKILCFVKGVKLEISVVFGIKISGKKMFNLYLSMNNEISIAILDRILLQILSLCYVPVSKFKHLKFWLNCYKK